MQSLRRTAVSTARKSRINLTRQPRRYAHDEHTHAAGHAPVNESFGWGFWGTVALVPTLGALYQVSRPDPDSDSPPLLTRMIAEYHSHQEEWAAKNDLHVRLLEQAGSDRVLFANSKPQEFIDLRSPDVFNVGSPYNVPAGSQANISHAIEKYRKDAFEDNERKLQALREGTIKGEQPVDRSPNE
ncbi:uncharacterized protein BDR25DRAFT_306888 [Lindgomyces ingoldianus]|uniref:Uncharacterized protein n=1 Tax=Lindgomyces ingoldianus TaxID=673940 RepID=A0ACB6QDQ9_9PLEO|nr:uncharacterized protein BDR25DRAFT_306888 [Lindgomyces ingoldianus]KAF2465032.1 hypothetical protein BDR25DRAFT_306888 [Lindgomyces ingoldianus]